VAVICLGLWDGGGCLFCDRWELEMKFAMKKGDPTIAFSDCGRYKIRVGGETACPKCNYRQKRYTVWYMGDTTTCIGVTYEKDRAVAIAEEHANELEAAQK